MSVEIRDQLQLSLGDAFVIEQELAPGGMSRLFLAMESSLQRRVVIKLLPPDTASEVSAARFQREVLVAARLQHPHILPVLTSGSAGGLFYYIMPFVDGESLWHRLHKGPPFSVPEAVRILREIADALALAHDRGIVHRDIKPANILLQEGHAVVTDFGIARAVEASRVEGPDRLTAAGVGIGTLGYMAPEQLAGERNLGPTADVYALAVVAYEMFAGKPPFSAPSAQALVTAHLSEPPPPLQSTAPGVPAAIRAVVEKALAKAPADRYQSGAEFRDALDVPLTAAFTINQPARKKRHRAIIAAATALATVLIVLVAYRTTRRVSLDPDYVVILPFNVRNSDTTLREGMVDILSEAINGQGWIKTVPPSRYIRTFTDRSDQATAGVLARRMDAGLAIVGSVDAAGADSLLVKATIFDATRGRPLGVTIVRTGLKKNLPQLGNEIGRAVLKELDKLKPLGAFRTSWLDETNLPALQAFLVAEQFYRRSSWDSATAYYSRAIDSDSAFALAYRHAGLVLAWRRGTSDSLSRAYLRIAGRLNHGLPRRDSLLVAADSVRSTLADFESDTAYFGAVRRLIRTLETARDSFPQDPEVWFALGDAYFHYSFGSGLSVGDDTILAAFDRSIKLDSGFSPAYIHALELALTRDGREAGIRYADRYLALQPSDEEADGIRVLAILLREGSISSRTAKILDTLSDRSLQTAWLISRRWADSAATSVELLQSHIRTRTDGGSAFITNPGAHRLLLASQLAYRGRKSEAYEVLGTNIGRLETGGFGALAALGGVPDDSARAVFARLAHDPTLWAEEALPWWVEHRDTTALVDVQARAEAELKQASTPVERRNWAYRAAAVRAYLALARRSPDALARFRQLPDSLCMSCYLDRLTKARLLDSLGQHAEASALLGERPYSLLTPLEIVGALQRARLAERLQNYDVAGRAYATVADAWVTSAGAERTVASDARVKAGQFGGRERRGLAASNTRQ